MSEEMQRRAKPFKDVANTSAEVPSGKAPTYRSKRQAAEEKTREKVWIEVERVYSTQGVYIISVASRILEMHPQTLRKYERMGFISPSRSGGMLRLYSEGDIARLRLIKHLVDDLGMNLAGVEMLLEMVSRISTMRRRLLDSRSDVLMSVLEEEVSHLFQMLRLELPPKQTSS